MLADLDVGTATSLAEAIAAALGAWMMREELPHHLGPAAGPVYTARVVGYLPGVRPEVLAARLGGLLPRDGDAVCFVATEQMAPTLAAHACRRVEGRAVVDGVPVVITLEERGLRAEVVATVVVSRTRS